ncbi:hypothetical protein CANARDRAFT_29185, partial [[Candida] arabinofermentans NRRL YB-2248]
MSLEGAIEEERKLIAQVLERQKLQATSSRGRDRGISPNPIGNASRGLSSSRRSLSRSSISAGPPGDSSITEHDPSERLRSPSGNRLGLSDDEEGGVGDIISSEEEQISDTDSEFEYDDGGYTLPNYATYQSDSVINENDGKNTKSLSAKEELNLINSRKMVKEAIKAEKVDEILAAERGLANAKSIGRHIPKEYLEKIEKDAKDAGTSIHYDPEKFYQDNAGRKEKLQEYAMYKKKLVSPDGSLRKDGFNIPYTSDIEEKADSELAKYLNENIKISEIESNVNNQRAIRTVTRGDFFKIIRESNLKTPKTFILCMDFSEESRYALEWCIGTVLVDGSVLFILNVIEDDDYSSMNLNGIPPTHPNNNNNNNNNEDKLPKTSREKLRYQNVEKITKEALDLLKLTKLQIHLVIESCHHPIPRHFMVAVIKHISPALVIVGSKGNSALKGVLLGSLANHLVRKSTVPIMVVKNKLKKLTKKGNKFGNNISILHSLAEAKV